MTTIDRRLKVCYIDESTVWGIFARGMLYGSSKTQGKEFIALPQIQGIPEGSELLRVFHEPLRAAFGFVFRHESFAEVDPCTRIPDQFHVYEMREYRLAVPEGSAP